MFQRQQMPLHARCFAGCVGEGGLLLCDLDPDYNTIDTQDMDLRGSYFLDENTRWVHNKSFGLLNDEQGNNASCLSGNPTRTNQWGPSVTCKYGGCDFQLRTDDLRLDRKVAHSFNAYAGSKYHAACRQSDPEHLPEELNFAFCGHLVNDSKNKTAEVCFAQGHAFGFNNWYIASDYPVSCLEQRKSSRLKIEF